MLRNSLFLKTSTPCVQISSALKSIFFTLKNIYILNCQGGFFFKWHLWQRHKLNVIVNDASCGRTNINCLPSCRVGLIKTQTSRDRPAHVPLSSIVRELSSPWAVWRGSHSSPSPKDALSFLTGHRVQNAPRAPEWVIQRKDPVAIFASLVFSFLLLLSSSFLESLVQPWPVKCNSGCTQSINETVYPA